MSRHAVVSILACLMACFAIPTAAPAEVLPSETCRGLFLVRIVYDERPDRSLLMVLDTGAGRSSVDPDALRRVFDRRVETGKKVNLRDGALGSMNLKKLPVEVHSMDALGRALGREIDGILGFPTFRSLLLTLDYPAGEVRVERGSLPEPDGRRVFADAGKNRPYVAVELGGERVPVLIDSGSTSGFTLRTDDPPGWKVEPRPVGASVRYRGIRLRHGGRVDGDVVLGPTRFVEPIVVIDDGTRLAGHEVLQEMVLTFDQKNRRIRMDPAGDAPVRSESMYGLPVAFRPREQGLEVLRLFDGDIAIREGDIVVSMDGTPVYARGCEPRRHREERTVPVELLRGGETHRVEVDVRLLVP